MIVKLVLGHVPDTLGAGPPPPAPPVHCEPQDFSQVSYLTLVNFPLISFRWTLYWVQAFDLKC